LFDFEKGRIKFIRGPSYPHGHTVFVDDDRRAVIDAASRADVLKALHVSKPIEILIVSHGHEDHFLCHYLFPEARFWVHQDDAPVFLNVDHLIDCYSPENEEQRTLWRQYLLDVCHYQVREADRLLKDGDILDFGRTRCEVIHTPGHTPGHCVFFFPEEKVLFLGDLDLTKAGAYYGDVAGSLDQTIESLKRVAKIPVETYLTGHGKGILDGDPEHIHRYLRGIEKREEMLLDLLSGGPKSLEEVTREGIIYGPPRVVAGIWHLAISERAMMSKHLDRLQREGRVRLEENRYHLTA